MTPTVTALTTTSLASAVEDLARGDADLAAIVARYGPPPLWDREPGFGTLLHIILEQQVSLASARSAFDRLRAVADPLTPTRFLELTDQLRVATEREVSIDPVFDRREPRLLEPRDHRPRVQAASYGCSVALAEAPRESRGAAPR